MLVATLLSGAIAMSNASASTSYTPTEAEANKLSVEQARDYAQRGFTACRTGVTTQVQVTPDGIAISWSDGIFQLVQFREMRDINVTYTSNSFWTGAGWSFVVRLNGHIFSNGRGYSSYQQYCNLNEEWVKLLGNALLRLKLEFDQTNSAEAVAQCTDEAKRYQAIEPRPEIPEEARRFRVQAEAAVASKRFVESAETYLKGIKVAPWWPEGHYNRAVILAELQSFDTAITEMKCYVALKPDAPDARQARDLMYVWETHPFVNK